MSGLRILETFSLHAESIINSKATVSSARKSFKQLSAEGFFRCGNRDRSCSYLTQLPTQFDAHMREEHADEYVFPCVHCGSVEMTCDSLLQHLEEHLTHQGLLLYCAEATCDFNSASPEDVLQHIVNSHSTLTSFICWCCSASFSSIHTFVTHVKQNILQVAKCPHCSAKDTDRQRILTHISNSHPGCGRMVRIHKLFLCEDRTMSAWQDQNAEHAEQQDFSEHNSIASDASMERPPVLRKMAPVVQNRNVKQKTDFIDLTGFAHFETPERVDNLSEDAIIIDFHNRDKNPASVGNDTNECQIHVGLPVQRTAEKLELRDNARCRMNAGEKSQNKVCERRVIDSICMQSTAAMAESSATSVDRDEHDDAGETEMEINHNEEEDSGCVLVSTVQKSRATAKRKCKTRKFGSNTRPPSHTVQEPNVSSNTPSNRPIPSTGRIFTKDCFRIVPSGEDIAYFCKFCDFTFNKESKPYCNMRNRMWRHINSNHKQNPTF